ncbi:MAG: hypothetical protein E7474_12665 [Ruminococcaceae bacterium]|nr:hypothetical protein [Oscillospiraceae bacterium]
MDRNANRPRSRERNASNDYSRSASRRGGALNLGGRVGNGGDYDGPVDASGIVDGITDAATKAGRTFNNCFCWNCGYGLKIAQAIPCPRCGALMNGPGRFMSPCVPQPYVRAKASHPSIRRYRRRTIIGAVIFAILFSIGLSIFMFASGELDFDDEGMHNMAMILTVIWLFWMVWLVYDFGSTRKKINKTGQYNQTSGEMDIYCAMCETPSNRRANYCGLCGCILPK